MDFKQRHNYENNYCTPLINKRIALGKSSFQKKKKVITYKHVGIEVRKTFAKSFIWSTIICGL